MRSLRVKKRIIGVSTLILAIVLANIPVYSRAVNFVKKSGKCGDNLSWFVYNIGAKKVSDLGADFTYADDFADLAENTGNGDDLILVIKGSGEMYSTYTENGGVAETPWKEYAANIVKLALPQGTSSGGGITKIGRYAFYGLSNLRDIEIIFPDGTTNEYGYTADTGTGTGFHLPSSLQTIENHAFYGCTSLGGGFSLNNVTSLGESAFQNCSALSGNLTIPAGMSTIPNRAFMACSGLTGSLTIPNTVTSIGVSSFQACTGLNGTLTLPNSPAFTTIPDSAFYDCINLTGTLVVSDYITSIGNSAFHGCKSLTGLSISSTNKTLTSLGEYAFRDCSGLTGAVNIPENVTMISEGAFQNCANITNVYITADGGNTTIGNDAFSGCASIENGLSIPARVRTIGQGAFYGTSKLDEVDFGGDAPEINGEGGVGDTSQSFRSGSVVLRFPADANDWRYPEYRGYVTAVKRPTGNGFEVEDRRQEDAANNITYPNTPPQSTAYFLAQGDPSHPYADHTLLVEDTSGVYITQLVGALESNQKLAVYKLDLVEDYMVSTPGVAKPCDKPFSLQVMLELPESFDLQNGKVADIFALNAAGQRVSLGAYTPNATTAQFNFSENNIYKPAGTTDRYGEIAILYEEDARIPDKFKIVDSRNSKRFPNALRAGFTNTSTSVDDSVYADHWLEIYDDTTLDTLKGKGLVAVAAEDTFTGYDIQLWNTDGTTNTQLTIIPGPGADNRLTIRVPVPKEIDDKMTADGATDFSRLTLWTEKDANTAETVPYTGGTITEGSETTRTVEFTVTHFSEFGFQYTPADSTTPRNTPFAVVDLRAKNSIQDNGRTTPSTLTASYVGLDGFPGWRLRIEDVQDTSNFTEDANPIVTLNEGDAIKVYNLTLVNASDTPVDTFPATPLMVTMPIPHQTDQGGNTVIWEPKQVPYVDVLRYTDNGGVIEEDTSFNETYPTIDGIETTNFRLTHNGQVAFVYRKPAGSVDVPFEVVWDESGVTTEGQQDTWRVDTILKVKGSDYLGKTEANGYKLQVVQVPDTNFTTNTSGEPVVDLNTDEDKEIAVYRFTLVDPAGNPVDPPTVSGLSEMNVTMPVLLNTTFGGNTINWDLNKGKVQAIRYEQTSSGRRMFHETFGTKDTTQEDNIDVIKFPLTENGEVAFIYTPDKTLAPFYIYNRTGENINFWSSYSPDDAKYNGVYLEITNPPDPSNLYQYVNPSNGKAVKSYVYTLRRIGTNEEVTTYPETMSVRMPIPTSTGEGTNAVQWVQDDGQVIEGVYRAYMDGTTPKVESMQTTVITESKEEQFQITKNGEYGLVYVPEPVVFEVKDQRSDGVKKGSNVIGDGKSNSNNTYADSYLKYNGDRYLIFKNPSPKAPTLKQLIDADAELNWYKEIEIYDIVFQDKENGGTDQTDHGEIKIRMNLPSNMNIMANEESHVLVVSQLNDALDKSIVAYNDKPLNQVSFTTNHFTDYALLYYDSATNSSTNASTGDSSATNASTGSSDGSTAGTTATGATTGSATATTATGATTSSATGSTTSTGATTGSSSSTGSSSGSSASTGSSTGASSATRASTGSTIPTAYTTNPGSGSRPDMPKTGDPGMYRMMGSAGLGLFGIYELISSIRVREKGGKRRLYRR